MNFINEMIQDIKEEFNNDSQHTTEKFNNNNLHTNQTTEHWRRSRNNRHRMQIHIQPPPSNKPKPHQNIKRNNIGYN